MTNKKISDSSKKNHIQENLISDNNNILSYSKVIDFIRAKTGKDFSSYKKNTIIRRLGKRLATLNIENFEDYYQYLQSHPEEIQIFINEILIKVTSFFRDPEAFEYLSLQIIPNLIKRQSSIRVWVSACSTGVEAYTIAMIFLNCADELKKPIELQVFATDIDPHSLQTARKGYYNEQEIIEEVPSNFIHKYFIKHQNGYQIAKEVRNTLLFTEHDLIKDPPFSRVDLISSRNLLIYLEKEQQQKLLTLFHYALNENGYLFLGNSESVSIVKGLYNTVDNKFRIYSKTPVNRVARKQFNFAQLISNIKSFDQNIVTNNPNPLKSITEKILLDKYSPVSILINQHGDILYIHGKTGRFLETTTGEPTENIISLAREGLKIHITRGLNQIQNSKNEVFLSHIEYEIDRKKEYVDISLIPIELEPNHQYLVIFKEIPSNQRPKGIKRGDKAIDQKDLNIEHLQRELLNTQERLQSTIQELESTNEELRSAYEESQSMNEELQSANEELETSKEELQVANEELQMLNVDLQNKIDELHSLNNDINNMVNNIGKGILFLDQNLNIKRFNQPVTQIINILDTDIGRPITHLVHHIQNFDLHEKIKQINKENTLIKVEINLINGDYYWLQIIPYQNANKSDEGLILTFDNITELKNTYNQLSQSQKSYSNVVNTAPWGMHFYKLLPNNELIFEDYNTAANQMLGVDHSELIGKPIEQAFPGLVETDIPDIYREIALKGTTWHNNTIQYNEGKIVGAFEVTAFQHMENKMVATFADITQRIKAEKQLRDQVALNMRIIETSPIGIVHINKQGEIQSANSIAEQILGLEKSILTGICYNDPIWEIKDINGENINSEDLPFYQVKTRLISIFDSKHSIVTPSGKTVYLSINAAPLIDENGNFEGALATITDITSLISNARDLQESEIRFKALAESTLEGIGFVSGNHVFDMNTRLTQMYDYESVEQMKGVELTKLFAPEYFQQAFSLHSQTEQNRVELIAISLKGRSFPVEVFSWEIPYQSQNIRVITVRDITERKKNETELLKAKEKAEESDRLKSAFLANMSHEIRTPMNGIIGFADLLHNEDIPDDKKKKYLSIIQNNGHHLLNLINDIIDISKIEANLLVCEKKDFKLDDLLNEIKSYFIETIEIKKNPETLNLILVKPDIIAHTESIMIKSDYFRIRQIFTNLIGNSIKFTREGRIEFGYLINEETPEKITFFVKDTGIGIPYNMQQYIFERFRQVEEDITKSHGGAGLGLSICKGLVELLGGKIWLESIPEVGSTFYFTVNSEITYAMNHSQNLTGGSEQEERFNDLNILVAEDDESSFYYLQEILEKRNANVHWAKNGIEAIKIFTNQEIDLVLMDIQMPEMNGLQSIVKIKAINSQIPIIAQTAYAMTNEKQMCFEAGCDGYLAKPLNERELCLMIKNSLEKNKQN